MNQTQPMAKSNTNTKAKEKMVNKDGCEKCIDSVKSSNAGEASTQ